MDKLNTAELAIIAGFSTKTADEYANALAVFNNLTKAQWAFLAAALVAERLERRGDTADTAAILTHIAEVAIAFREAYPDLKKLFPNRQIRKP